jgi:hypothetical protein
MILTAGYPTHEEASMAVDVLRDFGISARIEEVAELSEDAPWWEVTIDVQLPNERLGQVAVVPRGPQASPPADTEPDDYWRGTSRWDDQWERDNERRGY